ncbi:SPFH domain-containing protein [Alloacidobacterium sp.]|uniref:SPFH domain-containing protein n=1 Tax=Alloacidobacterium sp. TaxID=2951999 RepID=UPI002D6B4292|nr:SPFH domain-containing protein [Alloacidobacterium sp.]HYK38030.1 SPFH domain-containing protein [Alloacidobacterium sp.]
MRRDLYIAIRRKRGLQIESNKKENMKLLSMMVATFMGLAVCGCSTASPNAGYEGVIIEKPWFFGHGGVDPEPVRTGLTYKALSSDVVYVQMTPTQSHIKFDNLMSSDGIPLSFDAVIRVRVTDSVDLIKRFGEAWYEQNVEREFMSQVRQAVRKRGMNEMAISATAVDAVDNEVAAAMDAYLKRINMPVVLAPNGVTIGKVDPPDAVRNQRIETAQQEQRVHTEEQTKLAEDARQAAERSRAEADNAYRNAMSLSPEQFLELQAINMERAACTGSNKCIFIGPGVKASPLIDTK